MKASPGATAESEGDVESLRFRQGMASNRQRLGLSASRFGLLRSSNGASRGQPVGVEPIVKAQNQRSTICQTELGLLYFARFEELLTTTGAKGLLIRPLLGEIGRNSKATSDLASSAENCLPINLLAKISAVRVEPFVNALRLIQPR